MDFMETYPFVSFIIPTYNCESILDRCLKSIIKQKYPKDKIEILIIDGGSIDNTIGVAQKYTQNILENDRKIAEFGKSIGIQKAKGELIILLDSDNEIVQNDWLKHLIYPFQDNNEIFGVESFYLQPKKDFFINRYFTAIGLTDPLARALATKPNIQLKEKYLIYHLPPNACAPIGANGFLWRKSIIKKVGGYIPAFEEANFTAKVMKNGYNKYAKVSGYGIYHYYIKNWREFYKKKIKIAFKFLKRKQKKKVTWLDNISKTKFLIKILYCFTFIGPIEESIYNYFHTRDSAWFLHPIMCFFTVCIYTIVFFKVILHKCLCT